MLIKLKMTSLIGKQFVGIVMVRIHKGGRHSAEYRYLNTQAPTAIPNPNGLGMFSDYYSFTVHIRY